MQAVKEPETLESFHYREAFTLLYLSDDLWLIITAAHLILL